jgi:predicted HTH domain antitoxin
MAIEEQGLFKVRHAFKVTEIAARILVSLIHNEAVKTSEMAELIGLDIKKTHAAIYRTRAWLERRGITLHNLAGVGYYLLAPDREKLRAQLDAADGDAEDHAAEQTSTTADAD